MLFQPVLTFNFELVSPVRFIHSYIFSRFLIIFKFKLSIQGTLKRVLNTLNVNMKIYLEPHSQTPSCLSILLYKKWYTETKLWIRHCFAIAYAIAYVIWQYSQEDKKEV